MDSVSSGSLNPAIYCLLTCPRWLSLAYLTHWGRDEMNNISQTTFSNVFSSMKMFEFWLKFHWSLFPRVQLTIFQHWFRWWLGAVQATSHNLNQWWLVYRGIYASLGLNELTFWWLPYCRWHFKPIFLFENCCTLIQILLEFKLISLKFVPKSALVHIMACHHLGTKPLNSFVPNRGQAIIWIYDKLGYVYITQPQYVKNSIA